jgi:hypothetical protein
LPLSVFLLLALLPPARIHHLRFTSRTHPVHFGICRLVRKTSSR